LSPVRDDGRQLDPQDTTASPWQERRANILEEFRLRRLRLQEELKNAEEEFQRIKRQFAEHVERIRSALQVAESMQQQLLAELDREQEARTQAPSNGAPSRPSAARSPAAGDKLDQILLRLERMEKRLERLERRDGGPGRH
jgi:uncharacterized protein YaaN involved in tellurite resistance